MECNCLADAVRMLTKAKSHSRKGVFDNVFLNRYIISPTKFEDLNSLVNYISEKFLVANSKWGKYIVIEKQNGSIKYYRELTHAAQENSSSKSTLSKHGDATKDNPYLITKSNSLFYYTNEYIPISEFKAVPIEKSLELSSGNIGESPTDEDNIEISTETKESVPSYSVDGDPLN